MKRHLLLALLFIKSFLSAAQPDKEVDVPAGKLQIYYRYDQNTGLPYHPFARPEGCFYDPAKYSYTILIPGSQMVEEPADSQADHEEEEEEEKQQSSRAQRFPRAARPAQGSLTENRYQPVRRSSRKHSDKSKAPYQRESEETQGDAQDLLSDSSESSEEQNSSEEDNKEASSFMCEPCNQTFTTQTGLNNHNRLHTGKRQYTCSWNCGASFYVQGKKTQHEKTHTGEDKVLCPRCERPFSNRSNMNDHARKKHGLTLWKIRRMVPDRRKSTWEV